MSNFLDRLNFFKPADVPFADGHGVTRQQDRSWEDSYRRRWQYDKIVRSTHGVNCTGSCSWKVYVKNGLVTWETQQTDYPRTRPDLPNHEPRGCPRGASYSWYLYSANRVKYPLVRSALLKLWREARKTRAPVDAWASIVDDAEKAKSYKSKRGMGGFVRSNWDEVNEIIAAANLHTVKRWGPDRVIGFSPIPAMSMVSYAAGARYLSLLGGACLSFYDWYCDLPPSSPQVWGEQTDVPESADWYNSRYLIAWGSNVPQTRTPDAHFFTEARYNGTKTVAITPDYSEVAKLTDHWLHPKQGTDAALAFAMGHVILREFHVEKPSTYFTDYCRQYTDMPLLVRLEQRVDGRLVPERFLRASDLGGLGESNNPEWKTLAYDQNTDALTVPNGSVGFRWGEKGKWNIEEKDSAGRETRLRLSLKDQADGIVAVSFAYFGGTENEYWTESKFSDVLERNVPVKRLKLTDGQEWAVATVYDLLLAQYGIDRGLGGANVARSYDDNVPGTPAWQEKITGVARAEAIQIAREFARTADKTRGRSMIIVGAAMNHWYHCDMNYRGLINLLAMCGCVGQSGGGWAHYVGQEKLRPQSGWTPVAFGLDWSRPPRHMNGTSFWYFNSCQYRYEKLGVEEILSPLADPARYTGSLVDYNLRAVRMGWLPAVPQLNTNPIELVRQAEAAGVSPVDHAVARLKDGSLDFAFADPDAPENFPRNLFIWRSNLLGSSGKGHEYMLKHLLGTRHGLQGKDLGAGGAKPEEVKWRDEAPEGKLDLLVTLDFRMCTTALYSDIVLP
ncbi:MAG: nitrate reductase subunit alpha, partial [Xanthomonadales bacterium]|nr:nitrate reductase subunit alpha [Xanthomonadales bacterium]